MSEQAVLKFTLPDGKPMKATLTHLEAAGDQADELLEALVRKLKEQGCTNFEISDER